ncbi:MAG: ATP-dependent helicase [Candidatus Woesearchaeota archaeon]|nr:ATP-dependent helicase [Candidatus Woesearchaeota archaeon]
MKIEEHSKDEVINLVVDTLKKNKQVLIFVNAKRSAEKVALDIAHFLEKNFNRSNLNLDLNKLNELSNKLVSVLERPTVQCLKLEECSKFGVCFHHSGLLPEQKELIETSFREGILKVIVATPTLAAGVDLPAFRVIIRDLKRYSRGRSVYIPIMEYMQQAGRAGRPKYDNVGEAIIVVSSVSEREKAINDYILGEPEDIYSKLAVEPVLRTFALSLIAGNFFNTEEDLINFFNKTFWSHQYKDVDKIRFLIKGIISELIEKGFLYIDNEFYYATSLGKRVSELYLDPLTAYDFVKALERVEQFDSFAILVLISKSLELRPLPSVYKKDIDWVYELIQEIQDSLLFDLPSEFDYDFEEFLKAVKFAKLLDDWINELDEEEILEKYNVRPGELRVKLELVDWLIYALIELAKVVNKVKLVNDLFRLRMRLHYGAKEELIPLLKLKGIGKHRARLLYSNGIKNLGDVKKVGFKKLKEIIGDKLAVKVLEQVNITVEDELLSKEETIGKLKRLSRSNQSSLNDF